jgi:hypothetical protein
MKPRPNRILILLAFALLAIAPAAQAQINPDLQARVQTAVDLTDRRLEFARDLLAGCNAPEAQAPFALAVDLQGRAKARLSTAAANLDLELALKLTMESRAHADRAIALARCCVEGARIEAQLERTQEILERVRERVESCRQDRAVAMLRVAVELQMRARAVFAEGRCLVALQLTMQSRQKALEALRICGFEDRAEDRVQHFLVQTDVLIDRAREVVDESGGEQSRQALSSAVELQARAYVQFREGRFESALNLSRSARDAAERAIRLAKSGR